MLGVYGGIKAREGTETAGNDRKRARYATNDGLGNEHSAWPNTWCFMLLNVSLRFGRRTHILSEGFPRFDLQQLMLSVSFVGAHLLRFQ